MKLSKKPYKGTRDFLPHQQREQDYLFEKMKHCAGKFGYEPYNGPMIEEVELYKAKSGEELINDQIYSFTDRGERFVALRPEMTPTLARMIAGFHREAPKPIRWFSIPNLLRYEKPQRGRLREHWQFNCDIFGAEGREGEIEILQMAISLLNSFGAKSEHFEILINDRSIIDFVFNTLMAVDQEKAYRLYKIVDKAKKVSKEGLDKMIGELGLDTKSLDIFSEYLKIEDFSQLESFLTTHKAPEESLSFLELYKSMEDFGLHEYLKYDSTIVRGLDYYTGIVFEIFDKHPDNRRALCGGGAYANLLQIFNEPAMPGVGFGLGDVTLKDFLTTHELLPCFKIPSNDLFISYQVDDAKQDVLNLASKLRAKDFKVLSNFGTIKIKKAITSAEKKGARFLCLLGEDELSVKKVIIKDLKNKEQQEFNIDDIDSIEQFLKG